MILEGKGLTKFGGLRAKTYSYFIDDSSEDKKAKHTKICVIKRKHKFGNDKNYLEATQLGSKLKNLEETEINMVSIKKKS